MISSGEILNGGFRVLGRRPASVAVWALLHAALGMVGVIFVAPRIMSMMQGFMQEAMKHPEPDPAFISSMMQNMMGVQGIAWLLGLAGSMLGAVLLCGAFRATLRPEERAFASLRFGMDEVRIFLMTWIVMIGAVIAMLILFFVLALLVATVGFSTSNTPAVAALVAVLLWLAAICGAIYVSVRLSMLFPLTFLRREFVFGEAWKATRGRFWTLFLAYFVLVIVVGVIWTIVSVPISFTMFSNMPPLPLKDDPQAAQAWAMAMMDQWFSHPFGLLGMMVLVGSVVQAISTALFGGAMATAARGFVADDEGLPATFE